MALDLEKIQKKFDELLDDPQFVEKFEQWYLYKYGKPYSAPSPPKETVVAGEGEEMTEDEISTIDFELAQLEDYVHGDVGKVITKTRGLLQKLSQPQPTNEEIESLDFELAAVEDYVHGDIGKIITKTRRLLQKLKTK